MTVQKSEPFLSAGKDYKFLARISHEFYVFISKAS